MKSAFSIYDYLIDQEAIDWPQVLSSWSWLLPPVFTLWMVNRFANLFIVLDDASIHMVDVGIGTLTKLAESRDDFAMRVDEADNAEQWFMIPLVDELVAAGVLLGQDQCYGFKKPPVLGGEYTLDNISPIAISDYLGAYGSIHEQLKDVPDGAEVVLKIVNRPRPDCR